MHVNKEINMQKINVKDATPRKRAGRTAVTIALAMSQLSPILHVSIVGFYKPLFIVVIIIIIIVVVVIIFVIIVPVIFVNTV